MFADARLWVFPGEEIGGGAGSETFPPHSPINYSFLLNPLFKIKRGKRGGVQQMGGVRLPASLPGFVSPPSFVPHRLHGLCLAPALPRTWSPVKFRAAPWDTCRKPAALQAPCNHGNGGQWEVRTARGGGAYSARGWSGAWRELMGGIWVWFVRHSKADGACGNPQCRGRQPD